MLPGRGTLVPVECFRTVGLFDERRLPQYGADYEFSVRASRSGYRLLMQFGSPVYSVVEATGVSARRGRLPWCSFFGMFVSRRSPVCLLYRWRFALLSAPRGMAPAYLIADTLRVVGGSLRDQLRGGRT